jgi:hypothetical protein
MYKNSNVVLLLPTQSVKRALKDQNCAPSLKKQLNFGRGNLKTEDIEQEIVSARWGMKDEGGGGPAKSRNKETRHSDRLTGPSAFSCRRAAAAAAAHSGM